MPPKIATIPRFLLPQTGAIWRNQFVRNATTKAKPGKPLVLEKPVRFNPPSHGSRISKGPPRYQYAGPQMTEEQKAAQATKKYPSMMPPEGTFMYWFINNKSIHLYITMGVLSSLAFVVWSTNFKQNSPFAHMLPTWSETLFHPIHSTRTFFHVLRLNTEYTAAETAERRKAKVDDVQKRAQYRKAHGLDQDEGFGGWTAKSDSELIGPAIPSGDGSMTAEEVEVKKRPPVKKWLGIW